MVRTIARRAARRVKAAIVAVVMAIVSAPVRGDNLPHKVWHYTRTHKELLAYDAIAILGPMADAASSVHCTHLSPACTEGNALLPARPSNAQFYSTAGASSLGMIAAGHLIWHFAPRAADRQILVWIITPVAIGEARQTSDNVYTAERIDAARILRAERVRR